MTIELGVLAAGGSRFPAPRSRTGCRGRSRRASCRTGGRRNAVAYPTATKARSKGRSRRPFGNASTTWRKTTAGSRSNAMPIVYGTARLAEERRRQEPGRHRPAPSGSRTGSRVAATKRRRRRGRSRGSPRPASPACTPGSGMWSLVSARSDRARGGGQPGDDDRAENRGAGCTGKAVVGSTSRDGVHASSSHLFRDPAGRNPLRRTAESGNGWKERR